MFESEAVSQGAEREAGCEVVEQELVEIRWFQDIAHTLWRARAADGRDWWVVRYPVEAVYSARKWRNRDDLFSFHLGRALRQLDAEGLLTVAIDPVELTGSL